MRSASAWPSVRRNGRHSRGLPRSATGSGRNRLSRSGSERYVSIRSRGLRQWPNDAERAIYRRCSSSEMPARNRRRILLGNRCRRSPDSSRARDAISTNLDRRSQNRSPDRTGPDPGSNASFRPRQSSREGAGQRSLSALLRPEVSSSELMGKTSPPHINLDPRRPLAVRCHTAVEWYAGVVVRRYYVAALLAGCALAAIEWSASPNTDSAVLAFDVAAGWSFLIGFGLTLGIGPTMRIPALFLATGLTWFAGAAIGPLQGAYVGPLVFLLVAYPTGRVRRPVQWAIIVSAVVVAAIGVTASVTAFVPLVLVAAAVVDAIAGRSSPGPLRRGRRSAAATAVVMSVTMLGAAAALSEGLISPDAARAAVSSPSPPRRWGLPRSPMGRWVHDALARLVIELGPRSRRPSATSFGAFWTTTRWSSATRSMAPRDSSTSVARRSTCQSQGPVGRRCL